jgi:pimeloyl-ACP methyl ester carboxylesterase
MRLTIRSSFLLIPLLFLTAHAQQGPDPIEQIREAEIKVDLFALAGDQTRGREGGTIDELSASAWLAERAREAGLQPAGDNGTYFQFFPLERFRVSASSSVTLAGQKLQMGRDVVTDTMVLAHVDAPTIVASDEALAGGAVALAKLGLKERVMVVRYAPAPESTETAPAQAPGGRGRNLLRTWARGVQKSVAGQSHAALVVLVPDTAKDQWERVAFPFARGTYGLDPDGTAEQRTPTRGTPLLYVRESALTAPLRSDAQLVASIFTDSFTYPSVNVVAKVTGRDPSLREEHVLFSAHQDHDGVRYTVDGDNIWNGADDNATTAVALLAIGRAMAAQPPRRSTLFVWHGAEERGLMGSRWFVKHPTVPLKSIVAVLNGDMMGRNDPKTAALLGALPPHRNSPEFVQMAYAANEAVSQFVIDSSWDDPEHREGWYYRSDHLPYARAGIPALFFTTLLHADYHTPFDNPDRIDMAKLTKMTRWMYATGRSAAESEKPPALDPTFKLERCRDFTGNYCAPDESQMIKGPEGALHVDVRGSGGVPVLFIPSLAGTTRQWEPQLAHLSSKRQVVAIDLRGHGKSDPPKRAAYAPGDYAQDVKAALDALNIRQAIVVGHSMGSAAALAFAAANPGRVRGLLLVDPVDDPQRRPANPGFEKFLARLETADYPKLIEAYWTQILKDAAPATSTGVMADMKTTPQQTVVQSMRALTRFDSSGALAKFKGPVLSVTSPSNEFPSSLHNVHPTLPHQRMTGVSHWLHLDRPQEFNTILDAFLEKAGK